MADARRLAQGLSEEEADLLTGPEASIHTDEYQRALARYYSAHIYRLKTVPSEILQSQQSVDLDTYRQLWGPNECTVTGRLRDYDCSQRLNELCCPVLYVCGRYDEATPETVAYYHQQTARSSFAVFEESAHFPHLSEKISYLKVLDRYLATVDAER